MTSEKWGLATRWGDTHGALNSRGQYACLAAPSPKKRPLDAAWPAESGNVDLQGQVFYTDHRETGFSYNQELGGRIQDLTNSMSYSAQSYENYMVPGLFAPWASYLVQSANVQPGERVLDVACGTGIVARHVAPRVGSQGTVIGLDLNPDMLSVGRAVAEREGLTIGWRAGPAEQLPFPASSFDLILCQFGLMFFTERHKALTEMHRVLRAGGRVALSVWQGLDQHPFYQTLHDVSRRHLGKSSVQAVFSLGNSDELRHLLTDAGFQRVEIEPASIAARFSSPEEFLAWEIDVDPAETPALQDLDAQAQQAILAAVRQDMQAPLHEVTQDGQVVLASHAHVAHARTNRISKAALQ